MNRKKHNKQIKSHDQNSENEKSHNYACISMRSVDCGNNCVILFVFQKILKLKSVIMKIYRRLKSKDVDENNKTYEKS